MMHENFGDVCESFCKKVDQHTDDVWLDEECCWKSLAYGFLLGRGFPVGSGTFDVAQEMLRRYEDKH